MTPINEIDDRLGRAASSAPVERPSRPPLDLNLLVVLDALLAHRHVSRAADALGVGQPAASAALKRLRRHYGDVLLERSGNSYVLTPFATELATRVGAALSEVRRVADAGIGFEASSAQRTFELVVSDAAASVLLPPLLERMRTEAPGVSLSVSQHGRTGEDLRSVLRRHDGVVLPHELAGVTRAVPLFEDRLLCVADPQLGPASAALTTDDAAGRPWVLVLPAASSQPIGLGQLLSMVTEPRVTLVLDHFASVPSALRGTPHLAIVPERLVTTHPAFEGLRPLSCPWPTPPFRMAMHWDPALEHDAGHQWFRDTMAAAAATVRGA